MSQTARFWDASALIPLCVRQPTSNRARLIARDCLPFVWWGTDVEIHSAIARLHRSGDLSLRDQQSGLYRLSQLRLQWREVLPTDALRDGAKHLLDLYPLRAADSLQLAAALLWCHEKPARRDFICADIRLSEAAERAGFNVVRL